MEVIILQYVDQSMVVNWLNDHVAPKYDFLPDDADFVGGNGWMMLRQFKSGNPIGYFITIEDQEKANWFRLRWE